MTKIMGILNVTPDSFFDGNRYFNLNKAIEHGARLHSQGADLVDVGGESTRPGAAPVDEAEEIERVETVIRELRKVNVPLSIDTMKPAVALAALNAGAQVINDVTGFENEAMRSIAAEYDVPIVVMHMQGKPETMQSAPSYPAGIIPELIEWFKKRIELLVRSGIKEERITIDPGIGFGKAVDDNLKILQNLHQLKALGFPVLIGLSRKSFMGKILHRPPEELLHATVAMNTLAAMAGVDYLRVHDVEECRSALDLIDAYKAAGSK